MLFQLNKHNLINFLKNLFIHLIKFLYFIKLFFHCIKPYFDFIILISVLKIFQGFSQGEASLIKSIIIYFFRIA